MKPGFFILFVLRNLGENSEGKKQKYFKGDLVFCCQTEMTRITKWLKPNHCRAQRIKKGKDMDVND